RRPGTRKCRAAVAVRDERGTASADEEDCHLEDQHPDRVHRSEAAPGARSQPVVGHAPSMPRPWKTADMPVILSPSDGIDLRYDVAGTGPPLVLLHGSVLSRAIWRGLGYLEPLTEVRTVIRMDLRAPELPTRRLPTRRSASSRTCSRCSMRRGMTGRR